LAVAVAALEVARAAEQGDMSIMALWFFLPTLMM
jgi:hypothetical protein